MEDKVRGKEKDGGQSEREGERWRKREMTGRMREMIGRKSDTKQTFTSSVKSITTDSPASLD